jgi:RNA polymerase sigma-70 factor (ECF subfamily)
MGARAHRWGLAPERLRRALEASAARAFAGTAPTDADRTKYLESLHLEDLALACACAEGLDPAWEHFVREYRPQLYRAGTAIAGDAGRELADSLYAELFGLTTDAAGGRRSHFTYFHGRSSLLTWLRTVLSQRHVDRVRATRRIDPLPADETPGALPAASHAPDPARGRYVALVRGALIAAIARLAARDRLRLSCYYAQNLTLAEIGRLTGEHEATVSRHLTRTRRSLREAMDRHLRDEGGLTPDEISACVASVAADAGPLDLADLLSTDPRKGDGRDRSV